MYWSGLSAAANAVNAAAAYQTGQAGYVSHTPAAATYTTQRPAQATTYETGYQTAPATHTTGAAATYPSAAAVASTTYDYGYGRTAQVQQPAPATVVYDSTKTAYYAQPATATAAYSTVNEAHYQQPTKTPGYSNSNATFATVTRQNPVAMAPKTSTYSTAYTGVSTAPSYNPTTQSYSQSTVSAKSTNTQKSTGAGYPWQSYKKSGTPYQSKNPRPKIPPKPQQLHYCDVCKVSCAGPQTYREHLEGQKHKRREASLKVVPTPSRHGATLRCELCDVTCTGNDAYAAHIRGAKHQKVVKLHQKLGKPIPSADPVVVARGSSKTTVSTPSTGGTTVAEKKEETPKEDIVEKDVEPVGYEYIEEQKNGEVISFNCKLCDCKFNDPNAKEMHMKGRRHRLQYKKKVNPELVVDIKPSLKQRKMQEERHRKQQLREEMWRRREEERLMEEEERWYWEERRRYEEECEYFAWFQRFGGRGMPPALPPPLLPPGMPRGNFMPQVHMPMRRPDSIDDRHVIAKHADIYPKEEELNNIQKIVSNTEKALKMVSDFLSDAEAPKTAKKDVKKETEKKEGDKKDESSQAPRLLKGVMRVGILAKGLLLKGDREVQLVVLCGEKPTKSVIERVAENLPTQLTAISPNEKYEVQVVVAEASIIVRNVGIQDAVAVRIVFTSPILREQMLQREGENQSNQVVKKDPPDVLDKQRCLNALAALRHAKWFQARGNGLQSCVMTIRILRDLCMRVPTWNSLSQWTLELLCEKIIESAGQPMSPGDALKRVFEAISSGILLPTSPGLQDPCEKETVDATLGLTAQEREDITASGQTALRLIAFRQIHKVLGMDPLPPPKFPKTGGWKFNRKRRRNNSSGDNNDADANTDGRKDKKEKKETEVKPEIKTEK